MTLAAIWLARETERIHGRDRLVPSIDFLRTFEPAPGRTSGRQLPWRWQLLGARPIDYMAIRLPCTTESFATKWFAR